MVIMMIRMKRWKSLGVISLCEHRETEKRHRAAWPALIFPRFEGLEEAGLSTPSHCTLPSWVSSSPWESPGRNSSNLPAEGTPCLLTPHSSLFPGCQGGSPLARTDAAGLPGRRRAPDKRLRGIPSQQPVLQVQRCLWAGLSGMGALP